MRVNLAGILAALTLLVIQGCATYTTPAAGANISELTDVDIADLMKVEPAATFPSRIAVARIQAPGYSSRTNSGYGTGNYSVVTTRDIEEESDFQVLADSPMIAGVAPLSRLLLPSQLDSIKDLRIAAAKLKTDMLLIYSVDTSFHIEGTSLGPLSLITLGFIPNEQVWVTSTTSGILVDVRTGFVYGVAEATAREDQHTTIWNSKNTIDEARLISERASFKAFIDEYRGLWVNTLNQHGKAEG
ncbi:hypothetical protein FE810_13105 [Thalassotalea litorea]|uniref:DUF3313 domain-containing protein n=1 Tax=Thalassotalea litorea TaxID=2020715 RepID=A0A5R9IH60_9GAMM|nr:hypothetical protein [Thalassotalea litorea]TLU61990.1 hypothetical protein FE810_13105 [Thalassotalea litorea]